MTRKITLSIILIIFIVCTYQVIFGNASWARSNSKSISELNDISEKLNNDYKELERISDEEFEQKKKNLSSIIDEYKSKKNEYDTLISQYLSNRENLNSGIMSVEEFEDKDKYYVDFLWTIIGNYATEEGVDLTFNVIKNNTSAASVNNNASESGYIVCDLRFIITGSYIGLTDFIYDIEDDDRLNFEINDFEMKKVEDNLQVTLNVKEVKINTLIENSRGYVSSLKNAVNDTSTQIINSSSTTDTKKSNETSENK